MTVDKAHRYCQKGNGNGATLKEDLQLPLSEYAFNQWYNQYSSNIMALVIHASVDD